MKHTARTYNITVNHRRRILSTTTGHPSRWNDKTLVRFDKFVSGIHDGSILEDVEFELLERNEEGDIVTIKYKGAWLIVDNGYLRWAVTVPPFKISRDQGELLWSQWIESIRKDVECCFGIMKGRWRILKSGIRLHGVDAADQVWMTCCALHNWLLEIDGLDEHWENGVPSSWEGESGQFLAGDTPFAINRLYDTSAMGAGTLAGTGTPNINVNTDDTRIVRNLSLQFFRGRLIEHFDILFSQNAIFWPQRNHAPVQ